MISIIINNKNILVIWANIISCGLISIKAQIVPPNLNINNQNISSGIYSFANYSGIVSPNDNSNVTISGSSQVDYKAGQSIKLNPGFRASSFSGNGNFHAQIKPNDFAVIQMNSFFLGNGDVEKYSKIEYGLNLPIAIDSLVAKYFASHPHNAMGINPFDPDDINIVATFTSPSGTQNKVVYGFYYEDFSANWDISPTEYNFRVRFAPTEIGQWTCSMVVNSPNGKFPATYTAGNIHFTCVTNGGNKGYLQVGWHNRQLKFSGTGESFFAIGQNIPWIHHSEWGTNDFSPSEFKTFADHVNNIRGSEDGHDNWGNFVRIIMANWSHGIEWENLGDYSDYISTSGHVQNRQHNAFELDKIFENCASRGIYVYLDIEMQTGYNAVSVDGVEPEFLWGNNPYHTQLGLSTPSDMLTNPIAKKYFKRKLRYILSRWGYSTSLGVLELLSEQDNWDGYNVQMSYDMFSWHQEMGDYIVNTLGEGKHLLSISYKDLPPPNYQASFNAPHISLTSAHKYGQGRDINRDRYNIMNTTINNIGQPKSLDFYNRPAIMGEMGLTGNGADPADIEGCNDVVFHNNLWATAFMGGYGTGLEWFQEYNDQFRADNYPPLAIFFQDVDFETNKFAYPDYWKQVHLPIDDYQFEVFSLRNFNKEKVMGWAHNTSYWWGNISENCLDRNGHTLSLPSDNDTPFDPQNYYGDEIKIQNLKLLKQYHFDWYNTRGQGTGIPFSSLSKWTNIFGTIKTTYPGGADYAFKAFKSGTSFRALENMPPAIDTLLCGEDTIQVNGIYEDDTAGVYTYNWNFGNGQVSSKPYPTVIYSSPGTYNVKLIVTDTFGHSDTLQQQIVVLNCNINNNKANRNIINSVEYESLEKAITIIPNPNKGLFTLNTGNKNEKNIYVYNLLGGIVYQKLKTSQEKFDIDITRHAKGIYFIKIIDKNDVKTIKIITQ